MKVLTIFGTRPEIIRLSRVIDRLDRLCDHVLLHTGQNYDPALSEMFFAELGVRLPDHRLTLRASGFAEQAGQMLSQFGKAFDDIKPDRVLILGDTNSGLAAIIAARLGIPVFHMEAGNRCFDDRVPEEINRRIIDHCSTILLPYTHRSKENLLREGIALQRIFVTGNPIREVLDHYARQIAESRILTKLGVEQGRFFLATLHRAENVDDPDRLHRLFRGLSLVADSFDAPLVVSVHPRTRDRLQHAAFGDLSPKLRLAEPFGFFDFVRLEQSARAVLSDSGTVQEECCIFGVPNVTVRDVTERPETIEAGSNILTGSDPDDIHMAMQVALDTYHAWPVPAEYLATDVSQIVAKILLSHHERL